MLEMQVLKSILSAHSKDSHYALRVLGIPRQLIKSMLVNLFSTRSKLQLIEFNLLLEFNLKKRKFICLWRAWRFKLTVTLVLQQCALFRTVHCSIQVSRYSSQGEDSRVCLTTWPLYKPQKPRNAKEVSTWVGFEIYSEKHLLVCYNKSHNT